MIVRMVSRLLIFLSLLLLPLPAMAQSAEGSAELEAGQSLEGHWAFRIDEATIFVFRLDELAGGQWTGAWKRPTQIASNGAVFQRMGGSEVVVAQRTGARDGVVELVFAGPPGATRNDVLRFRQTGPNQAQLTYVGIPGDPYPLVRVRPDTALGPFEEARIYDRDLAVVEADYSPPEPEPAVEPATELAADDAAAEEVVAEIALPADEVSDDAAPPEVASAAQAEADATALDLLALEPLATEGEPAITWQPLGLVDDATAQAAAAAALGEAAPAVANAAPEPDPEPEPAPDASEQPGIGSDFLDGL